MSYGANFWRVHWNNREHRVKLLNNSCYNCDMSLMGVSVDDVTIGNLTAYSDCIKFSPEYGVEVQIEKFSWLAYGTRYHISVNGQYGKNLVSRSIYFRGQFAWGILFGLCVFIIGAIINVILYYTINRRAHGVYYFTALSFYGIIAMIWSLVGFVYFSCKGRDIDYTQVPLMATKV